MPRHAPAPAVATDDDDLYEVYHPPTTATAPDSSRNSGRSRNPRQPRPSGTSLDTRPSLVPGGGQGGGAVDNVNYGLGMPTSPAKVFVQEDDTSDDVSDGEQQQQQQQRSVLAR